MTFGSGPLRALRPPAGRAFRLGGACQASVSGRASLARRAEDRRAGFPQSGDSREPAAPQGAPLTDICLFRRP
ncbi:Hypothetical Protein RSKD131_1562 [Cereibacter sphaeroides KD131]|nr:Hypothetical Protein RSKD131_1562 [Cereibacter sphaeroides KD131]